MVGWHHQLNRHEFGWTLGVGDGQGGLTCCGSCQLSAAPQPFSAFRRLVSACYFLAFPPAPNLHGMISSHFLAEFSRKIMFIHFAANLARTCLYSMKYCVNMFTVQNHGRTPRSRLCVRLDEIKTSPSFSSAVDSVELPSSGGTGALSRNARLQSKDLACPASRSHAGPNQGREEREE